MKSTRFKLSAVMHEVFFVDHFVARLLDDIVIMAPRYYLADLMSLMTV
jgi:hypothetical protein